MDQKILKIYLWSFEGRISHYKVAWTYFEIFHISTLILTYMIMLEVDVREMSSFHNKNNDRQSYAGETRYRQYNRVSVTAGQGQPRYTQRNQKHI